MKRRQPELYIYSPLDGRSEKHKLYLLVEGALSRDRYGFVSATAWDRLGDAQDAALDVVVGLGIKKRLEEAS